MSHTTQRRGLDPSRPGREMIVLAMIPSRHRNVSGIKGAMSELTMKMLEHGPRNWLCRDFSEITIPRLGAAQRPLNWLHHQWPDAAERLLMRILGRMSSVVTALYTDTRKVEGLINDLKGDWLARNRANGYPISVVLSAQVGDVRECCRKTGMNEHTYLHSLGFFGRVENLPSEDELSLVTMCGHGLIATNRVRFLVQEIQGGRMAPRDAAMDLAKPCVCGLVNGERAEEILQRLSGKAPPGGTA
jgi:hypothetical protein